MDIPDVAAVLDEVKCIHNPTECCGDALEYINTFVHPECALAALAAAGYAVGKVPEVAPTVEAVVKHHACSDPSQAFSCGHSTCILAALSCSGFAVVKLPEVVVVPHGSRLVQRNSEARVGYEFGPLYAIEDSP